MKNYIIGMIILGFCGLLLYQKETKRRSGEVDPFQISRKMLAAQVAPKVVMKYKENICLIEDEILDRYQKIQKINEGVSYFVSACQKLTGCLDGQEKPYQEFEYETRMLKEIVCP